MVGRMTSVSLGQRGGRHGDHGEHGQEQDGSGQVASSLSGGHGP